MFSIDRMCSLKPEQVMGEVLKAEKALKERVGIGMSMPERALVNELKDRGIEEVCVLVSTHTPSSSSLLVNSLLG